MKRPVTILRIGLFAVTGCRAPNDFVPMAGRPNLSPSTTVFTGEMVVAITSGTPDAVIRYTTDSTVPTETSPDYTGPMRITTTTFIRAIALKRGLLPSEVASEAYVIESEADTVARPSIRPPGGHFTQAVTVSITDDTHEAVIRFTTDGSAPHERSTVYTIPFRINDLRGQVRARAWKPGMIPSPEAAARYECALADKDCRF